MLLAPSCPNASRTCQRKSFQNFKVRFIRSRLLQSLRASKSRVPRADADVDRLSLEARSPLAGQPSQHKSGINTKHWPDCHPLLELRVFMGGRSGRNARRCQMTLIDKLDREQRRLLLTTHFRPFSSRRTMSTPASPPTQTRRPSTGQKIVSVSSSSTLNRCHARINSFPSACSRLLSAVRRARRGAASVPLDAGPSRAGSCRSPARRTTRSRPMRQRCALPSVREVTTRPLTRAFGAAERHGQVPQ